MCTQSVIWSLGLRLKIPNIKHLEDCVHTVCDLEPGNETEGILVSNTLKIVCTQSAIWSLGLRLKIPNIKYLEDCVHTVCDMEPGNETVVQLLAAT